MISWTCVVLHVYCIPLYEEGYIICLAYGLAYIIISDSLL